MKYKINVISYEDYKLEEMEREKWKLNKNELVNLDRLRMMKKLIDRNNWIREINRWRKKKLIKKWKLGFANKRNFVRIDN